jgi:hypothetical protein
MRRLLQLGTFFFVLAALFAPLAECFDRWDRPGLSNDTEFAVFALICMLCLVLLVSKLISALALQVALVSLPRLQPSGQSRAVAANRSLGIFVPLLNSPPLRI